MSTEPILPPPIPPESLAARAPGRRLRRIVLGVFAAVAVSLIAAYVGWSEWTKQQVRAARARFRDAGLPTTVAELRPPAVRDADNAYPIVERLKALTRTEAFAGGEGEGTGGFLKELEDFKLRHGGYRLEAGAAGELAALLDRPAVREVEDALRQLTEKPGYDAKLAYEQGPALLVTSIQPLRDGIRLIESRVRLAASQGEAEAACASLWVMLRIAELHRDEPTLMSQLAGVSFLNTTVDVVEKTAATVPLSAAWLTRLRERFAGFQLDRDFVRALDCERVCLGDVVFQQLHAKPELLQSILGTEVEKPESLLRFLPAGLIRLEHAAYLDTSWDLRAALADPDLPPAERVRRAKVVAERIAQHHVLVQIVMPTLAAVGEKIFRMQVKLTVVQAGLALEEYRARHGRYSADLTELLAATPGLRGSDPCGGGPLVFRAESGGVLLYSIGLDLKDDGGVFASGEGLEDLAWHSGIIPAPRPPKPEPK